MRDAGGLAAPAPAAAAAATRTPRQRSLFDESDESDTEGVQPSVAATAATGGPSVFGDDDVFTDTTSASRIDSGDLFGGGAPSASPTRCVLAHLMPPAGCSSSDWLRGSLPSQLRWLSPGSRFRCSAGAGPRRPHPSRAAVCLRTPSPPRTHHPPLRRPLARAGKTAAFSTTTTPTKALVYPPLPPSPPPPKGERARRCSTMIATRSIGLKIPRASTSSQSLPHPLANTAR
jgi:hypothetical protein